MQLFRMDGISLRSPGPSILRAFIRTIVTLPFLWQLHLFACLAGITAFVILRRDRWPWLLVGWLWFVVTILPNAGMIQAGRQGMADRFTHLGTMGLTIGVVWAGVAWAGSHPNRRIALAWSASAGILILAALTIKQIGYWHDTVALFQHAIAVEDSDYSRG